MLIDARSGGKHVVVLDFGANKGLEIISDRELIPDFVDFQSIFAALGILDLSLATGVTLARESVRIEITSSQTGVEKILSGEAGIQVEGVAVRERRSVCT